MCQGYKIENWNILLAAEDSEEITTKYNVS